MKGWGKGKLSSNAMRCGEKKAKKKRQNRNDGDRWIGSGADG